MRPLSVLALSVTAVCLAGAQLASTSDVRFVETLPADDQAAAVGSWRSEVCDTCLYIINATETTLNRTQTQREIIDFLVNDVCTQLPDNLQLQCESLSALLVPQMVTWVLNTFPPAATCKDVGVCTDATRQVQGIEELVCPVCKAVMETAIVQLQDPTVESSLRDTFAGACVAVPDDEQADCKARMDHSVDDIVAVIKELDADKACSVAGACREEAALRALAFMLRARVRSAATGAANDACELCQIAVMEAAALLADPQTQAALTAGAKAVCPALGSLADACEAQIDAYAPVVFTVALQYLKPDMACPMVGFCPRAPPLLLPGAQLPLVMAQQVRIAPRTIYLPRSWRFYPPFVVAASSQGV